jgi:hypothetical protein
MKLSPINFLHQRYKDFNLRLSVSGHMSLTQDKGSQPLTSGASAIAIAYNRSCTWNVNLEREHGTVMLPARSIFPKISIFLTLSEFCESYPYPIPGYLVISIGLPDLLPTVEYSYLGGSKKRVKRCIKQTYPDPSQ